MAVPLVRSHDQKMVAGICAGLAVYFDLDVTLVRVLTVVLMVVTGLVPVALAYLILVFVIPEGDPRSRRAEA